MGQADILQWFEDHPGWHTIRELAEDVDRSATNVRKIASKLERNGDLECRRVEGSLALIYRVNKRGR